MSDRKYRQRGYMEGERESRGSESRGTRPQAGPRGARDHEGPRSPKMMAFGTSVKCAACGEKAPTSIRIESTCQKCNADLHTCKQCTFFDPGARFECRKPIEARIVNKNARNECELFEPRTVVERETSSGPPTDARQAFAKLFKK
jgi:hypothetical protein